MRGLIIGGVEFHAYAASRARDFRGLIYGPGGLQGVRGGVGVSTTSGQRPGRHGELDLPVFKSARVLTLNGHALARNAADLDALSLEFGGLGADGGSVPITYYSDGGLVLDGTGRIILSDFEQERGGTDTATYALSVSMRDPRWYGPERESVSAGDSITYGNIATASHRGNTVAAPRFTVVATQNIGANGYELKGKGRTFQVPGPLNVGQVDKVDFAAGTVRRDGALVRGVVPRTFGLLGGEDVPWRFWPLSGAGKATMQPRDTYY